MTIDKNTESEFINNGFVIPYPDDPFEMKSGPFYLGDREGEHWYLIGGEHEVPVSQIIDVDPVDED